MRRPAALFALHPLHVESVAWVAERKDVLATFLGFLALHAYAGWTQRGGRHRYALVTLWLSLGLMAKPTIVTLPCVMLLLDHWPLRRLEAWRDLGRRVVEKLPLLALAAATCVVTLATQRDAMEPGRDLTLLARIANALVAYVAYLEKTFWPVALAVHYPHPWIPGTGAEPPSAERPTISGTVPRL